MNTQLLNKITSKLKAKREEAIREANAQYTASLEEARRTLALLDDEDDSQNDDANSTAIPEESLQNSEGKSIFGGDIKPDESHASTARRNHGWKSRLIRRAVRSLGPREYTFHHVIHSMQATSPADARDIVPFAVSGFLADWAKKGWLETVRPKAGRFPATYRTVELSPE